MANRQQENSSSEELEGFHVDIADRINDEPDSVSSLEIKRRGRPPIQEAWTRVISLNDIEPQPVNTFVIATDLQLATQNPGAPPVRREQPWEPVFHPKTYAKNLKNFDLEKYHLSDT